VNGPVSEDCAAPCPPWLLLGKLYCLDLKVGRFLCAMWQPEPWDLVPGWVAMYLSVGFLILFVGSWVCGGGALVSMA
jgi:hypothetical protein